MTATAVIEDRGRDHRRFSIARAELELLLESARALVAAARAHDPGNGHLAQIEADIGRQRARFAARTFQVAVLALAKSGKSTLINALLGQDLLPSCNVPETACVVRIKHAPAEPEGSLRSDGQVVARGAAAIRSYLQAANAQTRREGDDPARGALLLEAPLVALAGRSQGDHPFEILDTPGPNEAGADALRASVERSLVDADVILYLLDYTKLRTTEERGLFERLATMRPDLLRRVSGRLFFAVNKIDLQNSRGLSPAATRDYVTALLRQQVPGLEIQPDRVLLLSAEHALLARQVQGGRADSGALRDFARLCFGARGQHQATSDECRRQVDAVLETSRVREVEDRLLSFLLGHSGEIFLGGVLDQLDRQASNLDNHLATGRRALQWQHGQLAERVAGLEDDLGDTERAFATIEGLSVGIADAIESWVQDRFSGLCDEVQADLMRAFDEPLQSDGADDGDGDADADGADAPWRAFAAVLEPGHGDPEACDEESAQHWIVGANRAVAELLKARFATFWSRLELGAWERQRQMLAQVEAQLAPLVSRIGDDVGRRLEIALRPVRLEIPLPSFDDLHEELARQRGRFVERRLRHQKGHETRRVRISRGGWCSDDGYQRRSIELTHEVTVFALDRAGLLEYWCRWIRGRTEVSIATARAIVRGQVGAAVNDARMQLAEYRDGYLRVARQALAESQRGELERKRRLDELELARRRVAELLAEIARCREFLGVRADPRGEVMTTTATTTTGER